MKKLCQLTAIFDGTRKHPLLGGTHSYNGRRWRRLLIFVLTLSFVTGGAREADAHANGEYYLFINVFEDHNEGQFEIPLI